MTATKLMTKDPVCGMLVAPATAPSLEHEGCRHFFCCTGCLDAFGRDPQRYLGALPQEPAAPTQPLNPFASGLRPRKRRYAAMMKSL